jgi:hypothetical protein
MRGARAQFQLPRDFDDAASLFARYEQREYQQAAKERVRKASALELCVVTLLERARRERLLGYQAGEQQAEARPVGFRVGADDALDLSLRQLQRDQPVGRRRGAGCRAWARPIWRCSSRGCIVDDHRAPDDGDWLASR